MAIARDRDEPCQFVAYSLERLKQMSFHPLVELVVVKKVVDDCDL